MSLSNQINCSEAEPRATGCRQAFCQLEEQERAAGRTVDLADGEFLIILPLLLFRGLCHVAGPRARSVGTSGIVRPLRLRSATWSSPRREACGAFGLRGDGVG